MFRIIGVYEHTNFFSDNVELVIEEYKIIKTTKCGVWISLYPGKNRFINTNAKKQFAHPTVDEAKQAFVKRKEREISILTNRLRLAKIGIKLCSND